jgi:hypothetical protein
MLIMIFPHESPKADRKTVNVGIPEDASEELERDKVEWRMSIAGDKPQQVPQRMPDYRFREGLVPPNIAEPQMVHVKRGGGAKDDQEPNRLLAGGKPIECILEDHGLFFCSSTSERMG